MEDTGNWSCNANDAVQIALVQPGEAKPTVLSTFHPQFTYPIFGDDEEIFGYRGLIIRLRFAAHDLRPHIHISYDEKFKAVEDATPLDLIATLKPFSHEDAFSTLPEYEAAMQNDENTKDFTPPGKLVHSYASKDNRQYEIWAGSLADPEVRRIIDRAQILVSFFIEGGTPIETDDPEWTLERWTVYFVYEKLATPPPTASPYSIVGYSTTYRWWYFQTGALQTRTVSEGPFPLPEARISELPARLRIAQFLILPPHQGSGHGTHLYNTIHTACCNDPTIMELTVEDPNEAFDVLRDTADFHMLRPKFLHHQVTINADPYAGQTRIPRSRTVPTNALLPMNLLQDIRTSLKIDTTQFAHILEMFLLSQIPTKHRVSGGASMARLLVKKHKAEDPHDRRYYWWRMLVKQRLYKRHRDTLVQLDHDERVQKLDETLVNVEEGYSALLEAFLEREKKLEAQEGSADAGTLGRDQRVKRKFTVQDDEDEEDHDQESAKRPKV
ncbi:hypothetical protein ASPZODRAFT_132041 [Penicilliopsis zonata CBS 506.65]|uniref:Histone acetyltransferase type B catalytic subunit n=1 Tax=Penicilliopsis zonata CBS 506.65 TaxID=1073090 RepID=A0A1L9SJ18_9EURO|nr:hypothetical protein ASPZODRAFT_132041 [Penicilliopsis zonata CBS 506.65]OJJ47101.1 hypothetical protein ASPZODRAFT_132041 [Penicilliopsis zonata CBS 506.65]